MSLLHSETKLIILPGKLDAQKYINKKYESKINDVIRFSSSENEHMV